MAETIDPRTIEIPNRDYRPFYDRDIPRHVPPDLVFTPDEMAFIASESQ
jgi:hypothetical protein